ncbi:OmpA family protein [Ulvibacterium sp.]|uniref:OmpA family protein n=1 Tax=Ulvibacterium sp. TaxID=2665914 RepID=UPI003BACF244
MPFKITIKCKLTILFVVSSTTIFAQNLVVNPSFELFNECPKTPSNMTDDVRNWSVPTEGTTDYFNDCSSAMGIPQNFNGEQNSEFGNGYAGFYMMAPNNYREYLQGKLSRTLTKGKKYAISFYISLADRSKYAIGDIGILFSKKKVKIPTREAFKITERIGKANSYNYTHVTNKGFYADKTKWMRVYKEIVADGNENYLVIGNFRNNAGTKIMELKGTKKAAYYYLDMVSVVPLNDTPSHDDLKLDKTYVLEDVLFPTDKYELNTRAKESLDALYGELKENPSFFVTVHAHTDSDGSDQYNKTLSSNRARAVARYLTSLGLEDHRIRWKGHGGEKPVADNTTAEGKRRNRRAEFVISKTAFDDNTSLTETLFEDSKD